MGCKQDGLGNWYEKFREIGISQTVLNEAKVSEEAYSSLYHIISIPFKSESEATNNFLVTESWQLELLTGEVSFFKSYQPKDVTMVNNPAYYAFCSVSSQAISFLNEFKPVFFKQLQNLELIDIDFLTFLAVEKRNIAVLTKLIELFEHEDLVLMHIIASDWYEGILWVDKEYPHAFLTNKNYSDLTDLIHYPHDMAFIKFDKAVLTWFIENKSFLFTDSKYNQYGSIITNRAITEESVEKLEWILNHLPNLLTQDEFQNAVICYKYSDGYSAIVWNWFEKNRPGIFPLSSEACISMANKALYLESPELFNKVINYSIEPNISNFIVTEKNNAIDKMLITLEKVLDQNRYICHLSIKRDVYFLKKRPPVKKETLNKIMEKLERNAEFKRAEDPSILALENIASVAKY